MKIALCLSGQPRFVRHTLPLIKKNLIDPNDMDVFIHTWFDSKDMNIKKSHINRKGEQKYDVDTIEYIKDTLNPKGITVEKHKHFANPYITLPNSYITCYKNINSDISMNDDDFCSYLKSQSISMFYSIYQSNNIKDTYATENGIIYDYVVRLRFDAVINFKLDIKLLNIPKYTIVYHELGQKDNLISDWINIGDNQVMNLYSSTYLYLEYLNCYEKYPGRKNTIFPDNKYSWGNEHHIRDMCDLFHVKRMGVRLGITICYN